MQCKEVSRPLLGSPASPWLAPAALLALARSLLEAFEPFHALGFVHCDAKADNFCIRFKTETPHGPALAGEIELDTLTAIDLGCSLLPKVSAREIFRATIGGAPLYIGALSREHYLWPVLMDGASDEAGARRVAQRYACGEFPRKLNTLSNRDERKQRLVETKARDPHYISDNYLLACEMAALGELSALAKLDWRIDFFSLGQLLRNLRRNLTYEGRKLAAAALPVMAYLDALPQRLQAYDNGLLREANQAGSAAKQLVKVTQQLTESERNLGTLQGNYTTLQSQLQQLQREEAESRNQESKWKVEQNATATNFQKLRGDCAQLHQKLDESTRRQRQLESELATARRAATPERSNGFGMPQDGSTYYRAQVSAPPITRPLLIQPAAPAAFEWQARAMRFEQEQSSLHDRIRYLESENQRLCEERETLERELYKKNTPWYGSTRTLVYSGFVALIALICFVFSLRLLASDPLSASKRITQEKVQVKDVKLVCQSSDESTDRGSVRFTTQQFTAINTAAAFIWQHACTSRAKVCTENDIDSITRQIEDSGQTQSNVDVLGINPGSDILIQLPFGCSTAEITVGSMALSVPRRKP